MQIYKIYDNGGKTIDRYQVLTEPWYAGKSCVSLGLSDDPESPQGFSQWGSAYDGKHLGKRIAFESLPENVQNHILGRLSDDVR